MGQQLFPTSEIPRINRIDRSLIHQLLDFRETLAFKFPFEELAASVAHLHQCSEETVYTLFLVQSCDWIVSRIGQGQFLGRFLIVLAPAK